jgi:hypothetical protein
MSDAPHARRPVRTNRKPVLDTGLRRRTLGAEVGPPPRWQRDEEMVEADNETRAYDDRPPPEVAYETRDNGTAADSSMQVDAPDLHKSARVDTDADDFANILRWPDPPLEPVKNSEDAEPTPPRRERVVTFSDEAPVVLGDDAANDTSSESGLTAEPGDAFPRRVQTW